MFQMCIFTSFVVFEVAERALLEHVPNEDEKIWNIKIKDMVSVNIMHNKLGKINYQNRFSVTWK